MAGVYKRRSDKARGKAGKWSYWFVGEDGRRKYKAGSSDRGRTLEIALNAEAEARRVREGIVEPGERVRREAALRPVADHVNDYRLGLMAKGDTARHAKSTAAALVRLLADASVSSVADLSPDRISAALGRLKANRSARTANYSMAAVRAFARWLSESDRIKEVPKGLARLRPYPEAQDRKLVRRALTLAELGKLLAAAESGPTLIATRAGRGGKVTSTISGPERAALYRLAMGTGFRANELRRIAREQYQLDGQPTVTLLEGQTKNGKRAVQPIAPELAEALRRFVQATPHGSPVFAVPEKTAKMLADDLRSAGIEPVGSDGTVIDFHALRHSYITHLIASGASVKVVQLLARHSNPSLTIGIYTHAGSDDLRAAVGKISGDPGPDAQR